MEFILELATGGHLVTRRVIAHSMEAALRADHGIPGGKIIGAHPIGNHRQQMSISTLGT